MVNKPVWAAQIQAKLKLHNISQNEFAEEIGKSYQWVSSVLNGKRKAKGSKAQFTEALNRLIEKRKNY